MRLSRDELRHEAAEAKKSEREAIRRAVTAETQGTHVQQLRHEVEEAKRREREAIRRALTAEKQEADAQQRATTAESTAVQPIPEQHKMFATHVWLAVTRVLGIQGQDLKRIKKASKHMHDTKVNTWEESIAKNTELIVRLRSVGKILMTYLFACVRIRTNTVPVEEVVRLIFPIRDGVGVNGGSALEEIRKAVRAAVSERRMTDAKMLLTLSISSFGAKKFKAMKEYFTHIEPIITGSPVTFLTPDKSPIKPVKTIECRNYSYLSKAVTRGTVVSTMANGTQIKVRHRVPGV